VTLRVRPTITLLDRGESYGYELRTELERSVGPQWGQLNIGHVYQLLERLRRDRMIEIVRTDPQPRRTERVIYAITDEGRRELREWLETPSPPSTGYRDDLYLKLTAAARFDLETLERVLRQEREALLGELHTLRELAAGENDELVALLLDGATLQVRARIELLDRAEHRAPGLTAPARAAKSSALSERQGERPPAQARRARGSASRP
jgi:DNA-binding PadR family transcriptional regulator